MKNDKGFSLIEIIVVLVLIGILATGASLFLITGVKGYLFAAKNSETTMKVQNALERLTLELRDAISITQPSSNNVVTSITYTVQEGSTSVPKTVSFVSGTKSLTITGYGPTGIALVGVTPTLLDNVQNFSLAVVCLEMDPSPHTTGTTTQEVRYVDVSTTIMDIPTPFTTKIYPRNLIACPY